MGRERVSGERQVAYAAEDPTSSYLEVDRDYFGERRRAATVPDRSTCSASACHMPLRVARSL